uniref:RRM domain-containing protein n=1 Tax=Rhizophagus irregularis (strain DAOM 181602 / DAOM 197198 / MUCL 43194) TaxID=747089 RepID=U9TFJ0_RHIID
MTGSGDAKRLIIHFHTAEARDLCVGSTHSEFPDLQFHLYDPKQLRSDEDLRAIQVTDIPFFITKPQLQSYFKKFGNLLALHLYSRKGAKMQQARIVYDHADAISRFTTQWAVYCFSTCLRVTPCHYSLDQKAARREFVAVLSGLPANGNIINFFYKYLFTLQLKITLYIDVTYQ